LERVKNSFNAYPLDQLALAGGVASFADEAYFQEKRQQVMDTRASTTTSVSAKELFTSLRQQDVIVRYFDKPRINDYLRITIGTDTQMLQLLDAINKSLT